MTLKPTLDAGIMDETTYKGWVTAAGSMYGENPMLQRDEAVRSAAMAAMTLMLAARDKGLVSCPMIGFDAAGVSDAFGLGDGCPVMLLTVGHPGAGELGAETAQGGERSPGFRLVPHHTVPMAFGTPCLGAQRAASPRDAM